MKSGICKWNERALIIMCCVLNTQIHRKYSFADKNEKIKLKWNSSEHIRIVLSEGGNWTWNKKSKRQIICMKRVNASECWMLSQWQLCQPYIYMYRVNTIPDKHDSLLFFFHSLLHTAISIARCTNKWILKNSPKAKKK